MVARISLERHYSQSEGGQKLCGFDAAIFGHPVFLPRILRRCSTLLEKCIIALDDVTSTKIVVRMDDRLLGASRR
jgi:hypothetical protein